VVGLLHQAGTTLIIYLDDLLILHQSRVLEALVIQTCQLFKGLGLMINRKKSHLSPVQNLEFLGFQVWLKHPEVCDTKGETLEDMAGCTLSDYGVSEGAGEVCIEDIRHSEDDSNSPLALQSHTEVDELSISTNSLMIQKFNVQVQLLQGVKDDLTWSSLG